MDITCEIDSIMSKTKAIAALLAEYFGGHQNTGLLPETLEQVALQIEDNLRKGARADGKILARRSDGKPAVENSLIQLILIIPCTARFRAQQV
jgi:hypothetical protein